ncbi:right-handed parallel beta-helix repeat-containing protein [Cellulophaga sp. F20128]|uniref:right-handed parallel beta-helix repeat-containing protein n=1 Tax=Cellulophaga sp. F20128 TaxID=2926413 RepID=UPI001FF3DCEC|nr:right-handed parallel beta-helix repeat-containing protein [Cellulophaga sp. F20128]MCK0156855.1 right-handed parallel beta-helix repeat-containing protein [Cellulophaga sp. F20128]
MKVTHIIFVRLFVFCLLITNSLTSCTQEDLLANIIQDNTSGEDPDPDPDPEPDPDPVGDLVINTTPCDYTLATLAANETLAIECQIDLEGKTVSVPAGVTLIFKGGEIINGSLNFTSAGKIDGDLLNHTLAIKGNASLISETFQFHPSRWDVVQGKVDMNIAKSNSKSLQNLIMFVHSIEGTTFKIDKLDAFFYGTGSYNYNIIMPSNFYLQMSDDTHLRTFPSIDEYSTFLILVRNVENVKISGGNLHGDRDLYDRKINLPPSHTIKIKSGTNVIIDNVYMSNATEDGLAIESDLFTYDPNYVGSKDIQITNCVFEANRRINLTITDGKNITIENCDFIDGGIETEKSMPGAPSANIDIEPVRGRDANGNLLEYQRVSHVYIRNNKQFFKNKLESDTKAGGFLISHGNGPIIIENNEMIGSGISFHTVDGVIIRNNIITEASIGAGSAESFNRTDVVYGNEIYGNTVKSSKGTALNIAGNGVLAYDNDLEGVVGVALGAGSTDSEKGVSNSKLLNNIIKASSRGITSMNTMENVTIEGNTLEMQMGSNFSFVLSNKWDKVADANFIVKNNTVTGVKSKSESGAPPILIGANSIQILNNKFGDVQIANGASNVVVGGNEIDANIGASGILFNSDSPNSTFSGNKITLYTSKTPLKVEPVKIAKNVQLSSSVVIQNNSKVEK